ncbi:hypothetical protein ACWEQG_38455 [Microbispora sp. NPDC004025]
MHQPATGQDLERRPLSEMFAGTGVEVVIAKASGTPTAWQAADAKEPA